ncbi:MAG: Transcriptional regulator LysR [Beijerinckiaceae bacterium]|nr:MAG: Transcriptional regulator LysR [Beijerinckiaceae bacterium]
MDSTALRYFSTVARLGSLQAAGAALNVAGSAISRQIAGLEASLGVTLFERHARGMRLTDAGSILASHARRQELETERVSADLRRLTGLESAILRVDTVEGMAQYVMPETIARLYSRRPGVQVQMSIPGTGNVPPRVRSGEADIGITFALAPEPEIRVVRRLDGAIMAFAAARHPLATRGSLALKELAGVPMFLMGQDTTVRRLFDMACAQEDVAITPVVVANSSSTIHRLVLTGAGLSVSSYLSMAEHVRNGSVVALPLLHPILQQRSIQVQVLAGRRLPVMVEAFLDCLDEVIAELAPFSTSLAPTSLAAPSPADRNHAR